MKQNTLTKRAQTIIRSTRKYDIDTRNAIKHALDESHDDLSTLVSRAEQGEIIWDISAEEAKATARRRELAVHIAAVVAHPDTPVNLYNAMIEQLNDFVKFDFTDAAQVERLLTGHADDQTGLYGEKGARG